MASAPRPLEAAKHIRHDVISVSIAKLDDDLNSQQNVVGEYLSDNLATGAVGVVGGHLRFGPTAASGTGVRTGTVPTSCAAAMVMVLGHRTFPDRRRGGRWSRRIWG
jgi:hypothetical protein